MKSPRSLKPVLACLVLGLAGPSLAPSETLVVNDQVAIRESSIDRPARGTTMTAVEAKFGAPSEKHPTVGSPPITRWDYPDFSVFFERDRVIHAVALR
jgi:hypothetical protein